MGLPPTSSKISTDLNEVTTFKFDFPNFTGTHTGTDLSLGINSVPGGGTGLGTLTANNVILGNGASAPTFVAPGSSGNLLTSDGTTWVSSPGGAGTGTVTSVALADGSTTPIYSISGSPVTTSGTLTETLMNQNANLVFAGPSSGSPAQPTFRALTNADLPSGSSAFAAYASSQVTIDSSAVTSVWPSFTTFSNSPSFTFTPTISGNYKVYCPLPLDLQITGGQATARIFNTSGGATLLYESQATTGDNAGSFTLSTGTVQSIYTLTVGITYVFDIQGAISSGQVIATGSSSPFYMFAEGIGLNGPSTGLVASAHVPAWTGGTPSGEWGSSAGSTLGAFNANTSAPVNTIDISNLNFGTVQTSNSNLPQITINNLVAGIYKVTANFGSDFTVIGSVPVFALNDGTTTTGNSGIIGGSGEPNITLTGIFQYATTANITFSIWGSANTGQPQIYMNSAGNPDVRLNWIIEKVG